MFNRFWLIHTCDRQTDGFAIAYSMLRMLSCAKNEPGWWRPTGNCSGGIFAAWKPFLPPNHQRKRHVEHTTVSTESVLTWSASETEDLECTEALPATVPWTVILAPHSTSDGLRYSVTGSYTTVTSQCVVNIISVTTQLQFKAELLNLQ